MSRLPLYVLRHGRETPPPERTMLRAGPLSLTFEEGGLRWLCLGGYEVLRGIYVAVRDRNWGTVPPVLTNLRIEPGEDRFRVTFDSKHRQGEIDFGWQGEIEGATDGTVTFTMDGEGHSTFLRNRIGFCALHPIACAGRTCHVEHTDGGVERSVFPRFISPRQPFKDIRAITHRAGRDAWATVRFDGDVFEMEDQRNWTDASFKTYCTPLSRPFPVRVEKGERIRQSVTLTVDLRRSYRTWHPASGAESDFIVFNAHGDKVRLLPRIGLGLASHGQPLSVRELERLRALRPAHLRADLRLYEAGWRETLERAAWVCAALGANLEGALYLGDAAGEELRSLLREVERLRPAVARWLVFHRDAKATPTDVLRLARSILEDSKARVEMCAGTDAYFAELNRDPAGSRDADSVCFSVNPQVHAFDDASLMETPMAQAETVRSARRITGRRSVVVSPVTLRPRYNPDATGPEMPPMSGEQPENTDPRQMALFGAAWTLASLAALAQGGARSVTFYETTGPCGVMNDEMVFPLYHVLADVGEFAGGEFLPVAMARPHEVAGLRLCDGGRRRWLVANLTADTREVRVCQLGLHLPAVRTRVLDETTAERAMCEPEMWRAEPGERQAPDKDGYYRLRLLPYAVARLDEEETDG